MIASPPTRLARLASALVIAVACVLGACEGAGAPAVREPAVAAALDAPLDTLCVHGVLDALCPHCHPALAAVFRARGDWCATHEMPESICPSCHPERQGRPVVALEPAAQDEVVSEGTRVTLANPDIAAAMGLDTVVLGAPTHTASVHAPARLAYDLSRVAHVGPRVQGLVAAVERDVGARVEAGEVLAWIDSTSVAVDRARVSAARAHRTTAEAAEARALALRTDGVRSERDLLTARQEAAAARSEHQALLATLRAVGGGQAARYALTTPIAGVVITRRAVLGAAVNVGDVLFEVVDPTRLWVELAIAERDAAHVTPGAALTLRVLGLETRLGPVTLEFVAPELDPHTRTVTARASIDNGLGLLRAHALAEAEIVVPIERASFRVPRAAVQRTREVAMLFVRLSAEAYEVRRVTVIDDAEPQSLLVAGRLEEGEEIVTRGSFLLRTETTREGIGAGCCEAPP